MLRVRGRVLRGRLIVDEPTELPEGAEIDLVATEIADDEAWAPELDAELERRHREAHENAIPAEEFLAKLHARRSA